MLLGYHHGYNSALISENIFVGDATLRLVANELIKKLVAYELIKKLNKCFFPKKSPAKMASFLCEML